MPLQVGYGVQVGVTQCAELNIRCGGRVEGNMTSIGMPDTGNGVVTGVVRVIDGAGRWLLLARGLGRRRRGRRGAVRRRDLP